nr:M48 family metalloprotease [Halopseudomonas salegens]
MTPGAQAQADFDLPSLGDTSAGIMSREQEYQLGRAWLGMLRGAVATKDDPLLKDYVESHVYQLAETSQLVDRRLTFVVVDSPQLNAFAAPGGIIGINGGLFLHAHTEGEFASVMAHELAHLSQRHFSRNLEQQQRMSVPLMAAMLASIVIAAAGGGDAGFAALASTQAAAIQEQRRFSRQNEQEADRIGILNLEQAGYDPRAMPDMFERLVRNSRFDRTPPEFLLTHPVTQSRIADSRNRAEQLAQDNGRRDSLEYQMLRARVQLSYETSPGVAVRRFQAQLDEHEGKHAPARYGLVLALTLGGQFEEAGQALQPLLEQQPDNLIVRLAEVELLRLQGQSNAALTIVDQLLKIRPDNYPLMQSKIDLLLHQQRYQDAERLSDRLTNQRSDDPDVWYMAAEIRGLADNITGLHMARAEYFMLAGDLDKADEQLALAARRVRDNFVMRSRVEARQQQLARQREILDSF